MILSDNDIARAVYDGDITITPYTKKQLNPNSYNLKWTDYCLCYTDFVLDAKKDNPVKRTQLNPEGTRLDPEYLYLFTTDEIVGSERFVPMIEGRSSLGRLGISIHITAGFGDIGFLGKWTLEVTCVQPVIVYPFMEVCQVFFHNTLTRPKQRYDGKYQGQQEAVPYKPD